jgi:hypothetical protein
MHSRLGARAGCRARWSVWGTLLPHVLMPAPAAVAGCGRRQGTLGGSTQWPCLLQPGLVCMYCVHQSLRLRAGACQLAVWCSMQLRHARVAGTMEQAAPCWAQAAHMLCSACTHAGLSLHTCSQGVQRCAAAHRLRLIVLLSGKPRVKVHPLPLGFGQRGLQPLELILQLQAGGSTGCSVG